MRAFLLLLVLVVASLGCERPTMDTPSQSASSAPELTPPDCVAKCIRARQMEAVGIEEIEATCKERCER